MMVDGEFLPRISHGIYKVNASILVRWIVLFTTHIIQHENWLNARRSSSLRRYRSCWCGSCISDVTATSSFPHLSYFRSAVLEDTQKILMILFQIVIKDWKGSSFLSHDARGSMRGYS